MTLPTIRQGVRELSSAAAARWRIASLLPRAGLPLVAVLVLCNIVLGLLPVIFMIETSIFLGKLPAVIAEGMSITAWNPAGQAFVLASAAFVAQQVLAPVRDSLGMLMERRIDGWMFRQLMATSMRSPGLAALEDKEVLSRLKRASSELEYSDQSPGKASAGLLALIARYIQLAGCITVITVMASWLIACAVLSAMLCLRHAERGGLRRYSMIYTKMERAINESVYLRKLAVGSAVAKEIRVFGLLGWLQARYRATQLCWLMPVWKKRRQVYRRSYPAAAVFGLLASATALAAWGIMVSHHPVTLTALAMTLQAVTAALKLSDFYPEADLQTQLGMNTYEVVRDFERGIDRFRVTPGTGELTTGNRVPARRPAIRFDNVTFRYPGEARPVFDGLDLEIPAGKCLAIVGANGAGKTTLVKLLTRMYDPTSGAVLADGVDIRAVPLGDWRKRMAVVFQDFLRYEVSASDNIAFGSVDHLDDLEGVREAALKAGAAASIARLPAGFDTPLTRNLNGGVELSGGQWQRVALARALFAVRHGASILVLDEPTASLDIRAETQFLTELMASIRGVTTIIISHRFSTVRNADVIVTLEEGRVTERGTHQELLRRDGRYAEMFRTQAERFSDGADHRASTCPTWDGATA